MAVTMAGRSKSGCSSNSTWGLLTRSSLHGGSLSGRRWIIPVVDGMTITRGTAADIPRLEPLWVAVHRQHMASMPELGPYVSDEVTWQERSALYEELFQKPDTFLLLASMGKGLIGYALVHVTPAEGTWVADTWVTGDRIAELESISVLPEHRGAGIGSMLMDECHRELDALGIDDVIVGLLPGNDGARRLYERHGYRPTWLYLSRFGGR
jgi:ribosomal protein S18 acetylase RimI-like enzyme